FLQFDIEHGAKSDVGKDDSREGDEGDQALGSVQGSATQTKMKDYSKLEALETRKDQPNGAGMADGKEKKYAYSINKEPKPATSEDTLS
ncbi:hypothetical protein MMJ63_21825, partial [Bacillus vallismortis]|nr:hypothetical protein [Bacillus vallismortis]